MPKILFLSNDCDYFLSHRLPVAIACRETGYEVHVAAPLGTSIDKIREHNFIYHQLDMSGRISNPLRELRTIYAIISLYRSVRPDLVHAVAMKSVLFGSIAARFVQIPAIVNALTGLGYLFISQERKTKMLRFLVMQGFRWGFRHRNCRVLFQNQDDCDLFVNANVVSLRQVTIIRGSGVDIDEFFPTEEDHGIPVVILPSRMLWDKGVGEFVEAAQILKNEGVQARFVLVGDIYDHNPATIAKSTLLEWASSGAIEWWGHKKNMCEVYHQAHVVCLPSYREGLPKVLIEAAACGRPIVTTNVPGCREVVIDGLNGYLVMKKNSTCLAAKLKLLIADPELRKRMGNCGRELALGHFDLHTVVTQTLHCYLELLECRPY